MNHPIHYPALRPLPVSTAISLSSQIEIHSTQVVFLEYPIRGTIFTAIITRGVGHLLPGMERTVERHYAYIDRRR